MKCCNNHGTIKYFQDIDLYCNDCGASLISAEMPCPDCGRTVYENDNFCKKCGKDLKENNQEEK